MTRFLATKPKYFHLYVIMDIYSRCVVGWLVAAREDAALARDLFFDTAMKQGIGKAHFKTLKYRPEFPERFGLLEHARAFCRQFFDWSNHEHKHSGIGLLSPAVVHYGQASQVLENRRQTLEIANQAHPERFVRKVPQPQAVPTAVWINPPKRLPEAGD